MAKAPVIPAPWQDWRPPKYSIAELRGDLMGGLVAALIALPYGLAMATLMGIPPMMGLMTSILTAPITALLGRNPVLIGGTSTVTVPFVASAVAAYGLGGAAKITIVAAIFMMVFCVLRLGGFLASVPRPVVSGFSCGIGTMMIISQLKSLFGLKIAGGGTMLDQLLRAMAAMPGFNWQVTAIGAVTIIGAATVAKRWPSAPAPMVGIALAAFSGAVFGWHDKEVGALTLALPPLAGFTWSPADALSVLPAALGLAVVTSVNLLITSRVVEHFRGKRTDIKRSDADRELGAYGIANLFGGLFGAPFSVGIPARSLANVRCGGTTRMSNLYHAGFVLLFMTVLSGAVAHVPISALAGVTAWMGFCLLEWSTWSRLHKMRKSDAAGFLLTASSVLVVNAAIAVAIGWSVYAARWLVHRLMQAKLQLPSEPVEQRR
ncbi:MAG: SulP family inorganic anion transporter [Acidobacteria bacterium]|nr:SulP family inorganic anion transporter [Acidobacteriota bacterium]